MTSSSLRRIDAPARSGRNSARGSLLLELGGFALLIAAINWPLLMGRFPGEYSFLPELVKAGQWSRLLTHPFAHVSIYHLLLDGAAFLTLYAELRHWTAPQRLAAVFFSATGALLAALTSPLLATHGLCGLSGVAHGLFALVAWQMLHAGSRTERGLGLAAFIGVVGKVVAELLAGEALLATWHFGSVGVPIVACHAGGIIGALAFAALLSRTFPRASAPAGL